MRILKQFIPNTNELVFVSDRCASNKKVMSTIYPNANHGHCRWHLTHNVKTKVRGKSSVGKLFKVVADAYKVTEFN